MSRIESLSERPIDRQRVPMWVGFDYGGGVGDSPAGWVAAVPAEPNADIRAVSAHIAAAVARVAYDRKLAAGPAPADLLAFVKSRMYAPRYRDYAAK